MKKLISIILCIAMLFSVLAIFGNAADDEATVSNAEYPIVFVTGIGQSDSYRYDSVEDMKADIADNSTDRANASWNLFCNDFSFLWSDITTYTTILRIAFGLIATIFTGHNFISKDACDDLVASLFRYNIVDDKGNLPETMYTPVYKYSVADMTKDQKETFYKRIPCDDYSDLIGEDMLYVFNYSAFSFTYQNADNLKDFIDNYVLPQTGRSKVVLVPMSMGASVVEAYLQQYGKEEKVAKVVSIVGAWYGSDLIADLVEKKYTPNAPELLYNGVVADLVGEPWGYLVNSVLRIFPKATLRSVIDELLGAVADGLLLKTPSLMVMVPYYRYQAIREKYLANNEDLAYVLEQTDKFYQAQTNLKSILTDLNQNHGVDFYYIAGYNLGFGEVSSDYEFFQFMQSADTTNSDEIIQIQSTATGATAVPAGTSFSEEYLASHDAKYIANNCVDVSTCFFPDHVWLFNKQKHELEYNNTALSLAFDIARGVVTDSTSSEDIYPRFNEMRDLRRLRRNYIPDLNRWLEKNTPTAEQKALIDNNNAAAAAMMANTKNNPEADQKVVADYLAMLYTLGVYTESEPDAFNEGLTTVMSKINDITYSIFGAKGFIDILKFW